MKKRMLLTSVALILGLASCGRTPTVNATAPATQQQKQAVTARVDKVTSKLRSLNFVKPASSLSTTAQATGSFTYDCDQGSITYSFNTKGDTGTNSSSLNLKSTTCTLGDTTFSTMDLNLTVDSMSSATDLSFQVGYNGGLTVKDAKETTKIGFENVMYDLKITKVNETTYQYAYTINGTVTANDSFVKYENDTRTETISLKI
jgi:hypothetical protein